MQIRNDFQSVSLQLNRLVEYARVFDSNNMEHWPHLKNNEDFKFIYSLQRKDRGPIEQIYCDGRDLAIFMSSRLTEFNYAEYFPTLKSFVDSFLGGWVYQVDILRNTSQAAKDKSKSLQSCPWAVNQMINLFDRQIEILIAIRQCLDSLRQSDLYKWEDGHAQPTFQILEYNKALDCIHSVGKMFERLPSTYANKDEEALRDHILVSLESVVYGSATGESFNKRGKTDILVRGEGANEFVGECKFWRGKEVFLDTINQLLSYLSWRDTKAGIILFVQNKDFGAVISKIQNHIVEHHNYLRKISEIDETWHNYEFRMNDDSSRVVKVAVMLYHMP
ncbi:hypothetical protein NIES30_19105 [Phormidium tenue NIES-30]|uniref:Uncharacterized protein n=2 Tax=Phormidium tenue TaxID=126344 RepID=A0A1U7J1D6_9CYAN|nr:hypothetical protein NIES30_19105 [Phormidium tenue NIES-30]